MDKIMLFKSKVKSLGFTLIEVMVAIVILMVGLLGMFQTINLAMDKNLENQYRENAIAVAEQLLGHQKAMAFENITARHVFRVEQIASNSVFKNFSTEHHVTDLAASGTKSKQISVRVWWHYKTKNYEHQTSSAIGNAEL
ncbi:MAG: prepilin-type N-terminal cleavage/methylation domain-containing protein [Geobacteraceae bacterium]|nr:prepilin-type N-terminal cleavage/methylation domain-containing protein [Geobacteraceae bacterium]